MTAPLRQSAAISRGGSRISLLATDSGMAWVKRHLDLCIKRVGPSDFEVTLTSTECDNIELDRLRMMFAKKEVVVDSNTCEQE